MRRTTWVAALAVAASAGAASAQGFRGAEIDLGSTAYTDNSESGQTTFQGSAEYGFTNRFGVAVDLGAASLRPGDASASTATVHLVFDVAPNASLGVFSAADDTEGLMSEAYGIEAGFGLGRTEIEGFAGAGSVEDLIDVSVFGLDGTYHLGDRFALTTSFAYVSTEVDLDASRLGIGGEARLGSSTALYLEVGEDNVDGATARYVGLGARFSFGPRDGTTFDPRGFVEVFGGL